MRTCHFHQMCAVIFDSKIFKTTTTSTWTQRRKLPIMSLVTGEKSNFQFVSSLFPHSSFLYSPLPAAKALNSSLRTWAFRTFANISQILRLLNTNVEVCIRSPREIQTSKQCPCPLPGGFCHTLSCKSSHCSTETYTDPIWMQIGEAEGHVRID